MRCGSAGGEVFDFGIGEMNPEIPLPTNIKEAISEAFKGRRHTLLARRAAIPSWSRPLSRILGDSSLIILVSRLSSAPVPRMPSSKLRWRY